MQNKSKLLCLITASLVAGTAAASAQGYDWNGSRMGWDRSAPPTSRFSRAPTILMSRAPMAPSTAPTIRPRARPRATSALTATTTAR